MLNFVCPGAGQLVSGQIVLGLLLLVTFLADFFGMMALFLVDLARYLKLATSGHILEGDTLENLGQVYHYKALFALLALGLVIYVISFALLAKSEKRHDPLNRPA